MPTAASISLPHEVATLVEPTYSGLAIANAELAADDRDCDVQKFHAACLKFEHRINKFHADGRKWYDGRLDRTLRESLDQATRLERTKAALETDLTELRWERFSLLPRLLPDFEAADRESEEDQERAIVDETARLELVGAGLSSMRAWGVNPPAAAQQLRHLVLQSERIRAFVARCAEVRSALNGLRAQLGNPPNGESCVVSSESGVADFARKLQALG
jgi:hypothetical protein